MDLSIILVALNGRDMTLDCFGTLAAAAGSLEHEVILVDNGSRDGTADAVEASFPKTQVIRNADNRGYGPAANQGMAAATGRVIALVNNDTRLPAGSLAELVAFLDRTPKCAIAGPQLMHEDGRTQHSFDVEPGLASELFNKSLLRRLNPKRYPSRLQSRTAPFEVENLVGACFVLKREIYEELGGFDETFFYLYEETDFCKRARDRGRTVMVVPAVKIIHLQGRTRRAVRVRARIEQARSRFAYFRKHRPFAHVVLRLIYPVKCLVEVIAWTGVLAALLALPISAWRRLGESAAVLGWQLIGCPRRMGLDRRPGFAVGDFVRITEGPFEKFAGRIESIRSSRVVVNVPIPNFEGSTMELRSCDLVRIPAPAEWPPKKVERNA